MIGVDPWQTRRQRQATDEADVEEDAEGADAEQPKSKFALKLPRSSSSSSAARRLLVLGGGGRRLSSCSRSKHEAKADAPAVKPAVFVDLPEVLVNLSNPGTDRTQYLKVKIVLELPEQKMIEQIQP